MSASEGSVFSAEIFGSLPDGSPVRRHAIKGGGLSARILEWGAVIQDLRLEGHGAPLVLGFERFADYPALSPYFGAIAGRYANRIAGGKFQIGGVTYQTDRNFLGKHTLHGGSAGFGRRVWRTLEAACDQITLGLHDPAGTMGFPGNMDARCTYRLSGSGVLSVSLEARCDAPTLCNLAHHSYFNLDDGGSGDILDHSVSILADHYLPVNGELIPTGEVAPVAGTPFDFRRPRAVRFRDNDELISYDHNFCLRNKRGRLRHAATIRGSASNVEMQVFTTEPGLQFYSGEKIGRDAAGLEDRRYGAYAGLAMEPQIWPDSPNQPGFPQALLKPGETYRQHTEFRFKRNDA